MGLLLSSATLIDHIYPHAMAILVLVSKCSMCRILLLIAYPHIRTLRVNETHDFSLSSVPSTLINKRKKISCTRRATNRTWTVTVALVTRTSEVYAKRFQGMGHFLVTIGKSLCDPFGFLQQSTAGWILIQGQKCSTSTDKRQWCREQKLTWNSKQNKKMVIDIVKPWKMWGGNSLKVN